MPSPIVVRVYRGDNLLRTEQFSREIVKIGRMSTAHLVLDEDGIARIHAVIEVAPTGALSIIDMGSAGGTIVNGKKVSRTALEFGDVVAVGPLRLIVDAADGAAEAPAPAAPAAQAPVPASSLRPTVVMSAAKAPAPAA
ncbi:MAG TPA: FHA domain-containing protein, partial [Anaeromyxobacteraceae bacterium]|nr:FHA domain-containing protein [Anaeromyxobacteraceae bacterium]